MNSAFPLLIYIHGFNSSPASYKAQYLKSVFQENGLAEFYRIPKLDFCPKLAMVSLEALVIEHQPNHNITLIGSSLGGYYATFLTEKYGVRSVLINPVVATEKLFADYLGTNTNIYTGEVKELTSEYIDALKQMAVGSIDRTDCYRIYLQKGDETQDYRLALGKYSNCEFRVEEGGSHGFEHFDLVVPDILSFAGIDLFRFNRQAELTHHDDSNL